jgi:hypothetical protein
LIVIAPATTMLFAGSVFLYWGTWNYLRGYGVRGPPMWFFMLWGIFIIFIGILISSYLGKMLRSKYLAAVSLLHLIIAPSLIYVVFSIVDPHYVYLFIPPMILSNIALDTAFLLGYFIRRLSS